MASRRGELWFDQVGGMLLLLLGASALARAVLHKGGVPVELTVLGSAYGVLGVATGLLLRRGSSLAPWAFALFCASFVAFLAAAPGARREFLIPLVLALFAAVVLLRGFLARLGRSAEPPAMG